MSRKRQTAKKIKQPNFETRCREFLNKGYPLTIDLMVFVLKENKLELERRERIAAKKVIMDEPQEHRPLWVNVSAQGDPFEVEHDAHCSDRTARRAWRHRPILPSGRKSGWIEGRPPSGAHREPYR